MEHPSEHTLELYVLQALPGRSEKELVSAHLKKCAGCRDIVAAASTFYADLNVDLLTRPAPSPSPSRSAALVSRRIPAIFQIPFARGPLTRVVPSGPLARFVRMHPFVVGGGGLALLGGVAALMLTFDLMPSRDLELRTVIENQSSSTIDAFNRSGVKLWSRPVPRLYDYMQTEKAQGRTFLQVADINGDGKNEVLTSLPLGPGDEEFGQVLHILNGDNTELRQIRPGQTVLWRGREYPDEFHIGGFCIGDFSGTGRTEIVILDNHLHSPTLISRFDVLGNKLGTYRHFGQLCLMGTKPLKNGAAKELIFYGGSDREEGNYTAVIVGLDPSRITGDEESSNAGGFGLPPSHAEVYYAHIPPSAVAKAYGLHVQFAGAKAVPLRDEEGFRIIAAGWPDSVSIYYEYIFRPDFSIVEVKSSNETKRLFDHVAARGLVRGSFFDDYMKVVASEIRYWDGRAWQVQPSRIND